MKQLLGFCLLVGGLVLGISSFITWYEGKSAAQELTKKEVQQYETIQTSKETKTDTPLVQTPSSFLSYKLGENVATLIIPALKQKYSVYWGTDEDSLQKGVGIYVSDITTAPNSNGHTVLSGHRDTVFTGLGELEKGDILAVEYDNKQYIYHIKDIWITDKDDRTVITKKDESTLTLTTCYPFNYVGAAPDRYIIQAKRDI
ncbi:class D sortase [Peribacillus cavernae]|uniref:Class D sortase n=1 Tax=Peribacillus cavernae TaxID=1674310 RepID=A0A433H7B5_9BACI|nr:class D sortase [Peribacillus cavernae]MDQ0221455.1 sortase A [Peribacillus cavernae]RUQ24168.1 class D sortase [Peribacillus cavernae]